MEIGQQLRALIRRFSVPAGVAQEGPQDEAVMYREWMRTGAAAVKSIATIA